MANEPIYRNDNKEVAIQYYQSTRHLVECPNGHQYVFVPEAAICMAWVAVEDAPYILGLKGGCCGKKHPGVYLYPVAAAVRIWTNKGGS